MAVRKTQKKHLGKKRKSLSKRKAHSKKKRHSKQRITKKRSHKGGGDDDKDPKPVEKASAAEEDYIEYMNDPEFLKHMKDQKNEYLQTSMQNFSKNHDGVIQGVRREHEIAKKLDARKKRVNDAVGRLNNFQETFYHLRGGKAHSKKIITKKRYYKGGGDDDEDEEDFIKDLKVFIETEYPKDISFLLKMRIFKCIDGEEITGDLPNNNKEVQKFTDLLLQKIEKEAPNDTLKDKMIDCVLNATRSQPSMPNKSPQL